MDVLPLLADELAKLKAASKARATPERIVMIVYSHVNADYRERAEPAAVMARLESIAQQVPALHSLCR